MTSLFTEDGRELPCTVVQAGPCTVTQIKTVEKDKYEAIQLGFLDKKESRTTKPELGHFKKNDLTAKKVLKELRINGANEVELGTVIDSKIFQVGDFVTVSGISKGKGYQGTVKRWGMSLQGKSHGTHESKRGSGSIGQCAWPSRVWKGKRMAGRMGTDKITVKNLEVLKVVEEENIIFLKGSVPGGKNGILTIKKSGV